MSWPMSLALVAGAYLLGAISCSYLLVRWRLGRDVRALGSGNAGATNVLRLLGPGAALLVLALDVGKGVAAVAAARALDAPGPVIGAAAVAAVLGHVFPVYHGFRGGKGVATAAGALGSLEPLAAALAAVVFLVVVVATRFVALGSIAGVVAFPLLVVLAARIGWRPSAPLWLLAGATGVAALVVLMHRINLERIRAGTEWRLGDPRGPQEQEVR